jgi:hypothetical protein
MLGEQAGTGFVLTLETSPLATPTATTLAATFWITTTAS